MMGVASFSPGAGRGGWGSTLDGNHHFAVLSAPPRDFKPGYSRVIMLGHRSRAYIRPIGLHPTGPTQSEHGFIK